MANSDPWIGKQVGNYRIVEIINRGGFGSVYKGKHLYFENDPVVAIKLPRTAFHTEEERAEFIKEAQLQRQLQHPHILPILDAGFQDGIPYLVTMYAAGGSLRDRLGKRHGQPAPIDEAVVILTQVGQALQYAHQRQPSVVHRDLKPENILFDEKGHVLLADFGIAVLLSSVRTGLVGSSGTPPYMAPEQFEGLASTKSDQYALGCIAYELVTGRRLFNIPNPTPEAFWYRHAKVEPEPPTRYNSLLPAHIEQAILIVLSKDRTRRHSDVSAFIQALIKPPVGTTLLTYRGYTAGVTAMSWSPDGTRIASGSWDHTVRVWEAATGKTLVTYHGHTDVVFAVAWSPDGMRIASGSRDQTVQVWEAATGKMLVTYLEHTDEVNAVAWLPDGTCIASGSWDQTVQVWEAATGKTLVTYHGHQGFTWVHAIAWSPDGTRIASGSGDRAAVKVWEATTGKMLVTYHGHTYGVNAIAWSPDGKRIATSGSGDRIAVQVWDAATGQALVTYLGHTDYVYTVAWSPDGTRIASGSGDKTVQVWEVATGKALVSYLEHSDGVYAVAWSPDGKRIASGSFGVKIWQAE